MHSCSCPHLWCQRLAQLVECGGGGELEIGLLIELVRPDVPIGRGRGRSCEEEEEDDDNTLAMTTAVC